MKTAQLIPILRKLVIPAIKRQNELHADLVEEAAERLEQLSTGVHSTAAEFAEKCFSPAELARMYDIRAAYSAELQSENKRLKEEIAELKEKISSGEYIKRKNIRNFMKYIPHINGYTTIRSVEFAIVNAPIDDVTNCETCTYYDTDRNDQPCCNCDGQNYEKCEVEEQ